MSKPTSVRSVFISSRMSMARERGAAYHAVADTHFFPLLFERELHDPDNKRMMELLLDSADYFITIYEGNSGHRRDELFGLTPIEYEFWRFLARVSLSNGLAVVTTEVRTKTERLIEGTFKGSAISPEKYLRSDFIKECLNKKGTFYDILRARVRLLVLGRASLQYADCEFVRFLPEECIIRIDATPSWTAHHEVYRAVYRRLLSDCKSGVIERARVGLASKKGVPLLVELEGEAQDRPGALRSVLESCLEAGLNLNALRVEPVKGQAERVRFLLHGSPTRFLREGEAETRTFLDGIRIGELSFPQPRIVPAAEIEDAAEPGREIQIQTTRVDANHVLFVIPFVDVPGALWELVTIVSSTPLGGAPANITSILVLFRG